MRSAPSRRVFICALLAIAIVGMFVALRSRHAYQASAPAAPPPTGCADTPAALIVVYPAPTPITSDTLSLDLPGPILVEPTSCPAPRQSARRRHAGVEPRTLNVES